MKIDFDKTHFTNILGVAFWWILSKKCFAEIYNFMIIMHNLYITFLRKIMLLHLFKSMPKALSIWGNLKLNRSSNKSPSVSNLNMYMCFCLFVCICICDDVHRLLVR